MSALVFMDTETTGLSITDDLWEFAAIRREPDGTQTGHHFFIQHDQHKCAELPDSFRRDHQDRYDHARALTREQAAFRIHQVTEGKAHIVGAVPNFDTERIGLLLAKFGLRPSWHHHLIDVEALALGYLYGGRQVGNSSCGCAGGYTDVPSLPWNSDDLSRAIGVEPPGRERHTAEGDVRWVMSMYDKITGEAA